MTLSPQSVSDQPTIRLTPRADARRIRFGAPWVFANDLVLDRRTKKLAPGTIARLEDAERQFLAQVAVTPASKIAARVLDRSEEAVIDGDWIAARITRAAALRARIYDAPFYRLIHAEADGMPGVVIDRFGDHAVVQPNAAWADARMPEITSALQGIGITSVIMNGTGRARALEGLPEGRDVICGTAPDAPIPVPMNGATYMADLMGGQKTGLFYDQRPNHAFAQTFAKDARVLDVFSHVGGFGLAALAGGAVHLTCVDGSAPALALAQAGADAMGREIDTRQGDAFDVMTGMAEAGEVFDVVICDPPAFAPAKPALEAGLRAYERVARLAAPLVAPDGILGLCSCSHAADLSKFRASSLRGLGRAGRSAQILHTGAAGPDHPTHPALAESGYLKAMFLRLGAP
ncbi:MAG: class I SAM-dependent rRNA methyltransferase [Pseudomonadota bacterium]